MKQEDIIIFSSDDWGWKTSKYHLSTRFARDNRVLFVSSIGFRSPTVSSQDIGRILAKLKSFFSGVKRVRENLYVLTPLVLPFRNLPFAARINRLLLTLQLKYAAWKLRLSVPYVFAFSQNWYDFVVDMPCKKLIYYCVDDHSCFKGIDSDQFAARDRKLAERADLIVCSSLALYERKKTYNPATHYLPHGVDYDLFSRVVFDEGLPVADDIAHLPRPVIGFYGHISHDWIDVELVRYLAEQRPHWSFLFIGKYSLEEDAFAGCVNIHLLGQRELSELPTYCKGIDVGIIPFVKSALTDNCNPLKLYEYIAAGLPVVSTDIPEVRRFKDTVFIAGNKEEFLDSCQKALTTRSTDYARTRSMEIRNASWDDRVDELYRIVAQEIMTSYAKDRL